MDKKIKYLIHYDMNDNEGRVRNLAAINKANYIIETLGSLRYETEIISASLISTKGYIKKSITEINENTKLIKLPAFKWGNYFEKAIAYTWSNIAIFLYLLFNVKKREEIVVYHSLALMKSVKWAKKLKGFKLILEVEEIYNDVIKKSEKQRKKEVDYFKIADKYIFPTELLNESVNKENKPYAIIHGTYQVEQDRGGNFNDDKIHVLYAGTLDPRKGGATAAASAEFLAENYHVHILGFGGNAEVEYIKKTVSDTGKKTKATVTYDGLLSGEEYIRFIQKCQIGLSTQNPNADFNATSFPSKILSYMANGLRVVSVRIPAIERSAIGDDMYYYDKQTPEEIANAIMSIDLNDEYDGREKIKQLDVKFIEDLEELIENGEN